MNYYVVWVYCPDCYGEDTDSCFSGGRAYVEWNFHKGEFECGDYPVWVAPREAHRFEAREGAEDAGLNVTRDSIWKFVIEEDKGLSVEEQP